MQHFFGKLHLNSSGTGTGRSGEETMDGQVKLHELIDLCKQGDRSAAKNLYDLLSPKMYSVCLRYMGDRTFAEDVLQEGFLSLFTKLGSYSGEGSFEGWSRRIFVNTALISLRKKNVLGDSENIESAWNVSGTETTPVQNLGYMELMKLVGQLPTGFRTVFNLYVLEGYSHKEIAVMLGISENTSRSQLQRARMMLQDKIRRE